MGCYTCAQQVLRRSQVHFVGELLTQGTRLATVCYFGGRGRGPSFSVHLKTNSVSGIAEGRGEEEGKSWSTLKRGEEEKCKVFKLCNGGLLYMDGNADACWFYINTRRLLY